MFVCIESRDPKNPIQMALQMIVRTFGHEIVECIEEAEIAVTNSSRNALSFLKASDDVRVVLSPMEFPKRSEEAAAKALAQAYPERLEVRDILAYDEIGLVPHLLNLGKEAK